MAADSFQTHTRSATRSFALRERGFSSTSSRVAMMGFFVRIRIFGLRPQTQTGNDGGQVQPLAAS